MLVIKFSYKIIILLFTLAVLAINYEENQIRTHAGEEVDIKSVPYTVSTSFACTGALVKPQWVLSAAHCFVDLDWTRMTIGLGATDWTKTQYNIRIEKIYIHPDYEQQKHTMVQVLYDIAVIKLAHPAVLSESIHLLELEETGWPRRLNKRLCTLAGFGLNIYNNTKLHMSKFYFTQGCICIRDRRILCTKILNDGDDSPCYGDSGSVVVCDNKGVAITSLMVQNTYCTCQKKKDTQVRCDSKGSLHLFSYMQPHIEWFKDVVFREPDTYLRSKASTFTIKGIQYYSVKTTSIPAVCLVSNIFFILRLIIRK